MLKRDYLESFAGMCDAAISVQSNNSWFSHGLWEVRDLLRFLGKNCELVTPENKKYYSTIFKYCKIL